MAAGKNSSYFGFKISPIYFQKSHKVSRKNFVVSELSSKNRIGGDPPSPDRVKEICMNCRVPAVFGPVFESLRSI